MVKFAQFRDLAIFTKWSNPTLVKLDQCSNSTSGQFLNCSNSKLVIQTLVKLLTGQIRSVPGHRLFEQTGQIRDWSNFTSGQIWPLLKFQTGQILNWSNLTTGQAPNWSTPLSPGLWPVWPLFDQFDQFDQFWIWPVSKFDQFWKLTTSKFHYFDI